MLLRTIFLRIIKWFQLRITPMDALLFPGRLRPGKRSASIGRRLYINLALYSFQLHITPMDALLFPGRLRPGKRSASIGRRFCCHTLCVKSAISIKWSQKPGLEVG